jgi:hypothetical protein
MKWKLNFLILRYTGDVVLRGKTDIRVIAVELSVQVS